MSRPVGAAGAGCGGAGLLGILLAVAIAVWLGSQSLGGIGGGSGRGDGDGETATSLLATQTAEAITGTLDPAGPVAVGQVVRLRAPIGAGAATLRVCLSAGERAPDTTRCSVRALTTDVESEAMNAQGVELRSAALEVPATIEVGGLPRRCDEAPGACVLMLRLDDGSLAAISPLTFAT